MTPAKRRVLVTGASGLLGSNLVLLHPTWWDIIAVTNEHSIDRPPPGVTCARANLLVQSIDSVLTPFLPLDAVIHTAALTDVDRCEREPEYAMALNADLPAAIAAFAQRHGIHLVHISTDHIFDGRDGNYTEASLPHPINVYAHTKFAAEEHMLRTRAQSTIVRTDFFGFSLRERPDLAGWICGALARREPIRLFRDVRFSPLIVNALVSALIEIVDRRLTGVLNVAAADGCSKEVFGRMLAHAFQLSTNGITSISLDDAGLTAPRPKDITLNTGLARTYLTTPLPTVAQSIEWYRQLVQAGYDRAMREMAAGRIRVPPVHGAV